MESVLNSFDNLEVLFFDYEARLMKVRGLLDLTKSMSAILEEDLLVESMVYSFYGQFLCSNLTLILPSHSQDNVFNAIFVSGLNNPSLKTEFKSTHPLFKAFSSQKKQMKEKNRRTTLAVELCQLVKHESLNEFCQDFKAEVVVPIWGRDLFYGVFVVGSRLDLVNYTNEELEKMNDFSDLAGITIENARLFNAITLDRMTKAFNKQFFLTRLKEDISSSKEAQTPLTLVMTDIDFFKKVNDSYGHLAGDFVLTVFSRMVLSQIESLNGFLFRYGGEEFAMIFYHPVDVVFPWIESIRESVKEMVFKRGNVEFSITLSFGITLLGNRNITPEQLIEEADKALYESKRNGRNQSTIYIKK